MFRWQSSVTRLLELSSSTHFEGSLVDYSANSVHERCAIREATSLLTNVAFSVTHQLQSDEIGVVAIRTGGDKAFYSPAADFIQLPLDNAFRGPEYW